MKNKKILGDFQTPAPLVHQIFELLKQTGKTWSRILEPTCGTGTFIQVASSELAVSEIIGVEIQPSYVELASKIQAENVEIKIVQANIFTINTLTDLPWKTAGPLLVVGNPPWITNAAQGMLQGDNLPEKLNFKGYNGIEAITGRSNFDVAEYIWIKLIHDLRPLPVTFALLCKTSVARNVFKYLLSEGIALRDARMYAIDAKKWFSAAVDACMFTLSLNEKSCDYKIDSYRNFTDTVPDKILSMRDGVLVTDTKVFEKFQFLKGKSPIQWRQGVKHDAAAVMELEYRGSHWFNKYGKIVEIEDEYLYPFLKSSDIKPGADANIRRSIIIPQKSPGENTKFLQYHAPKLWIYLNGYQSVFEARKSSIYKNKPPFAIFGIGDYSFTPYKVVVSGFYKTPDFKLVVPFHGKTVLCDDTCYLLPCTSFMQAAIIVSMLNHPTIRQFISTMIFPDAKRPITKSLLSQLDLVQIAQWISTAELARSIEALCEQFPQEAGVVPTQKTQLLDILLRDTHALQPELL